MSIKAVIFDFDGTIADSTYVWRKVDEDFFKLKNTKRMDATLQHEIGHSKMHSMNPKSSHIDTSMISSEQFAEFVKTNWKDAEDQITKNFKDIMGRVPTREEKNGSKNRLKTILKGVRKSTCNYLLMIPKRKLEMI